MPTYVRFHDSRIQLQQEANVSDHKAQHTYDDSLLSSILL
jgi:hypothetical protein